MKLKRICALGILIGFLICTTFGTVVSYKEVQKEKKIEHELRMKALKELELKQKRIKATKIKAEKERVAKEKAKKKREKEKKEKERKIKKIYEYNLYLLSHLIYAEGGAGSDQLQLSIGSVALNRVKSNLFPNTLHDVIFAYGQYACTWDGNFEKTPSEQAIKNAKYLLDNGSILPDNVVFQAEFLQGRGVYAHFENTYFCYY